MSCAMKMDPEILNFWQIALFDLLNKRTGHPVNESTVISIGAGNDL